MRIGLGFSVLSALTSLALSWPSLVHGAGIPVQITDEHGSPVISASIAVGQIPSPSATWVENGREYFADDSGRVELPSDLAPGLGAIAKAPGYRRTQVIRLRELKSSIALKPFEAKAAYLTYAKRNSQAKREDLLDLLDHSELNSLVMDFKSDDGFVATAEELAPWMRELKKRGIYTIARIVTFKDNHWIKAHPELATQDRFTHSPWIGRGDNRFMDPFKPKNWQYVVSVAEKAVRVGFDEIQFDYVRFGDGKGMNRRDYSPEILGYVSGIELRSGAIAGFLASARTMLGPMGVYLSADTFAYTSFPIWFPIDNNIGQKLTALAPHLDYLSPMAYQTLYTDGGVPSPYRTRAENSQYPSYAVASHHPTTIPYPVVYYTVLGANGLLHDPAAPKNHTLVRPWIQAYQISQKAYKEHPDHRFQPDHFGLEIKGVEDGKGKGYMLWNDGSIYDLYREYLAHRR